MNTISSSIVEILLHTLWQGALLAGVLFLSMQFLPAHRARLRYGLAIAALGLIPAMALTEWGRAGLADTIGISQPVAVSHEAGTPATGATAELPRTMFVNGATNPFARLHISDLARWGVIFWLSGAIICLGQATRGVLRAEGLRRRATACREPEIAALINDLSSRLRYERPIQLLVSDEIMVPCVMGALHPVLLLPSTLPSDISREQLRAVVAHELAHLRRWDYLANLGQLLLGSLLFFNPFVWWISRQIRQEREACCDQTAVQECTSRECYVSALVATLDSRNADQNLPSPLLAVRGSEGQTVDRARRLLIPGYRPTVHLSWCVSTTTILAGVLALFSFWAASKAHAQNNQTAASVSTSPAPSTRTKNPFIFGRPELDEVPLLGLAKEEALRRLGTPEEILGPEEGYQTYEYGKRLGLSVVFHDGKLVQYVIGPNSSAHTPDDIHIGSTTQAVTAHYGAVVREETVTEWFAGLESKVLYSHPKFGKFKINYEDAEMTFMLDVDKKVEYIWVGWIWNAERAK